MKPSYPFGATPLDPAEVDGLIPSSISTQAELNAFEQANILEAYKWLPKKWGVLTSTRLKELHRRMFDQTWRWAGDYRKSDKTIGVSWPMVSSQLEALCRDVAYWIKEGSYPPDEIAVRFHHRLVSIHCFPNGNGRHARLAADCLVEFLGRQKFSWGGGNLYQPGELRKAYIESLRAADHHDISPLLKFARS